MVYLKLQPYVQSSVATRANHKLSFKYFGPFAIIERIGKVAYKLQLPSSSTVHPVFHVSQLKHSVGSQNVSSALPDMSIPLQIPEQVLDRCVITRGGKSIQQVLIHWSATDEALSSWEDEAALRARFPAAPAWGQVDSQGRRMSETYQRQHKMEGVREERSQMKVFKWWAVVFAGLISESKEQNRSSNGP
jgi:hypothetical protein